MSQDQTPKGSAQRTSMCVPSGGKIPKGGSEDKPLELFVANAGTAARFLTAMVCLGNGVYRLSGVPRMHERPQRELIRALRVLGYRIDTPNDKLPAVVYGAGPKPGPGPGPKPGPGPGPKPPGPTPGLLCFFFLLSDVFNYFQI